MASSTNLAFDKFSEYYKSAQSRLQEPLHIWQREFGFLSFGKTTMLRHRGVGGGNALSKLLESIVPSDAYYSSAYYERPEADMDEKGWLGADLVFDIDADHIPTPCGKIHDSWVCSKCSFAGRGPSPEKCPVCGEAKFTAKTWICDICLQSARNETSKLVRMLTEDFGFKGNEVRVYFSGNRGFHVHVESESIRLLDSLARKEIVDYVIGLGLKMELQRILGRGRVLIESNSRGWRRRIARGIEALLKKELFDQMEESVLTKHTLDFLSKNRSRLIEQLQERGHIEMRGLGTGSWRKLVEGVVSQEAAKVDTVVTTDTHRLIRLAGSLHGKTGFMKIEAPLSTLDSFDPLKEAVAFTEGRVLMDVAETPEFRIGDTMYGPFKNVAGIELPTAVALFLYCKGAARVTQT